MKTKIIILISFIYSFAAFGFEAAVVQAPPIPGVGIVIKRNPGGGASKVLSSKDGSFSMELTKGSYLVSLNQDQLMKVGQELVKTYSPKSKYQFNGDGTQMLISENENIIMSQLEGTIAQDLMLITVTQNTTLQGSLHWDNSVVEQPQGKSADYVGHVTLIRRSATTQNLQVFCPTGTIGMDGKCVPIKELENLPIAQTADYVGHVTLLKKNAQSIAVASTDRTEGEPVPNLTFKGGSNSTKSMVTQTNTTDYVGHVTLLRFSQLYVGGGLQMPSSTTKEGANSVNGIDFNIGYYQPIWAWEKSMISLGLNAELGYSMGNGDYVLNKQYTIYNLNGQLQPPTVQEKGSGSPKAQGFRGAAGLQLNVHLSDKFTLSPIINAGYLGTTHKSFSVTETVYYNGSEYNYDLLSQKESKTSGLGILPKLRMTYNITPRIGIWLEGNYTMGPKIKTETTRFVLDPSIPSDSYNLGHFAEGQYITTKKETSYSAVGVNGGIVFSLGKPTKSDYVGHVTLIKKNGQSKAEISCPEGYTMINGRCIPNIVLNEPWLDNETGLINYFEYTQDYTLTDNELTKQLGVEELVIAKGRYTIERSNAEAEGVVILTLKKPIKTTAKQFTVESYNPRGKNCNDFGNNCFYVTEPLNKADVKSKVSITPIEVNGVANQIKVRYDRGVGPPGKELGF